MSWATVKLPANQKPTARLAARRFFNLSLFFVAPPGSGLSKHHQDIGNSIVKLININGDITATCSGTDAGPSGSLDLWHSWSAGGAIASIGKHACAWGSWSSINAVVVVL
jgi:hypothetical protein